MVTFMARSTDGVREVAGGLEAIYGWSSWMLPHPTSTTTTVLGTTLHAKQAIEPQGVMRTLSQRARVRCRRT